VKILIVNDVGCLSGGAEQLSHVLREGLRARGHDARLFTSTAAPVDAQNPSDYTCYGTDSPLQRVLQVANPDAMLSLRKILRSFEPDVVHVRMFLGQLSPAILPLLEGRQCVLHIGSYQLVCPLNLRMPPDGTDCTYHQGVVCHSAGCVGIAGLARTLVHAGALRHWRNVFSRVVANSRGLADHLALGGLATDEVIWNGTPAVEPRPPLGHVPTVAYAGRLVTKKGAHVLVRAMRIVLDAIPEARLIVAGDGENRRDIEALVAELGISRSIEVTGHLDSIRLEENISSAWVMAVPTIVHEAFSNTAIEAMMRGTAVIASNVGGFPEMIDDGVNGALVPRGDPIALGNAIVRCLSDKALCERMGASARERAMSNFTVDRMVNSFLDVYQRVEATAVR
jgi:glycosyltransferase involved in cell wall biosynthesis